MRNKLTTLVLGVVLSFLMTTAVFAEDVYVTKNGKKYHKADSRFVKGKEVEKLSREEAEARGYEPSKDFLKADSSEMEKNKK